MEKILKNGCETETIKFKIETETLLTVTVFYKTLFINRIFVTNQQQCHLTLKFWHMTVDCVSPHYY